MSIRPVFIAAAMLAACASPDMPIAEVASTEEALWVKNTTRFWPSGRVPVCFQPRINPWTKVTELGTPNYVMQVNRIRTVIESAFETIPGASIDFTGWATCPGPPVQGRDIGPLFLGGVKIMIKSNGLKSDGTMGIETGGWQAGLGYRGSQSGTIFATDQGSWAWGAPYDNVVLHEAVHVLGFSHEYLRHDFDRRCTGNGTDGDGSQADNAGFSITTYDHESIANETYCGEQRGLTDLDRLGLAIVYPDASPIPIVASNGFNLGSHIVTNGSGYFATDWTWRGADDEVFAAPTPPHWAASDGRTALGITVPVDRILTAGFSGTLAGVVHNWLGTPRSIRQTQVLNDSSYHTALIPTIL